MRKYLATLILVTFLTMLVWVVSLLIQPLLPPNLNNGLILLFVALLGVMAVLGPLKDVSELVSTWLGHIEDSALTTNSGPLDKIREQRHRARMLAKVQDFWVRSVFEQSLHGMAMIHLGMEYKPEAILYPWDTILRRPNNLPEQLQHGVRIVEVFDRTGGELLILGAPGSGKTTILLDLARELIARAERDDTFPMPVIFHLASWSGKHSSFVNWLIEELNIRYQVPTKTGRRWLEGDEVLLMLDGLDEVQERHRSACVEAINNYRKEHGLASIVVCSRNADYEVLSTRLRLNCAIVLRELTYEQSDQYLVYGGEQLSSLRTLLHKDKALQELAQSPLMMSIMTLAYRGLSIEELAHLDTFERRRTHLLKAYINRMFEYRGGNKGFVRKQAIHWLNWLAQKMTENAQSIFFLEGIQPNWLSHDARKLYGAAVVLISATICGIAVGLVGGIIGGFTGKIANGLLGGTTLGSICGLLAGFLIQQDSGISSAQSVRTVETLRWAWPRATAGVIGGFVSGLFIGMAAALFGWWSNRLSDPIQAVEFSIGLGLWGSLFGGLVGGLAIGDEIKLKTIPNWGIWRSARNAILTALATWLFFGLVVGLSFGAFYQPANALIFGVGLGQIAGLVGGFMYGGVTCIKHTAVRLILMGSRSIPLDYVSFLDDCTKRILLRKVGGGYIFVHRLIMDHFASPDAFAEH